MLKLFKLLTLSLAITCLNNSIHAQETFGPYQAIIINVDEGDTIYTQVEIWPGLFRRVYVRIKDIDSPEPKKIKGGRPVSACEQRAARKAIKFVQTFVANATTITLTHVTQIKSTANYVFARIMVDGKDLGEALVSNQHAISVTGLKRKRWSCRNA